MEQGRMHGAWGMERAWGIFHLSAPEQLNVRLCAGYIPGLTMLGMHKDQENSDMEEMAHVWI